MKKPPSKVAHNWPRLFFQYCQSAQIQPESQSLFHNNLPPPDFFLMTLVLCARKQKLHQFQISRLQQTNKKVKVSICTSWQTKKGCHCIILLWSIQCGIWNLNCLLATRHKCFCNLVREYFVPTHGQKLYITEKNLCELNIFFILTNLWLKLLQNLAF